MLLCRKCHSSSGCTNAERCEMKFTFGPVSYGVCEICHNRDFMGANGDARQECVDCTSGRYSEPSDVRGQVWP
jgi:hypothetical protein